MEILGQIIVAAFMIVAIFILYDSFLKPKVGMKNIAVIANIVIAFVVFLVGGYIAESLEVYASSMKMVFQVIRTIISYGVLTYSFSGNKLKKMSMTVFAICLVLICEVLSLVIFSIVTNEAIQVIRQDYNEALISLQVLLSVLIILIIRWFRRKREAIDKPFFLYLLEIVIPLISIIAISIIFVYSDPRDVVLVCPYITIINLVAYFINDRLEKYYNEAQKYALDEQQHILLDQYYNRVDEHQQEVRKIKDDLIDQLNIMEQNIIDGKIDLIESEVDSVIDNLSEKNKYNYTAHAGLNALLGAKARQAEKEGISLDVVAKIPSNIEIDDIDLAVLVGNIFDNAIEACMHCEDHRFISLNIFYHNDSLAIFSENSTDNKSNNLKTRKEDKLNHGIGLTSIRSIVDKYSGYMHCEFDNNKFGIKLTLFVNR